MKRVLICLIVVLRMIFTVHSQTTDSENHQGYSSFSTLRVDRIFGADSLKETSRFIHSMNAGIGLMQQELGPSELFPRTNVLLPTASIEYQVDLNTKIWGARFGVEFAYYHFEEHSSYTDESNMTPYNGFSNYDNHIVKLFIPVLLNFRVNSWRFSIGPSIDIIGFGYVDVSTQQFWSQQSLGTGIQEHGWIAMRNPFDKSVVYAWGHIRIGATYNFLKRWNVQTNFNFAPPYYYYGFIKFGFAFNGNK